MKPRLNKKMISLKNSKKASPAIRKLVEIFNNNPEKMADDLKVDQRKLSNMITLANMKEYFLQNDYQSIQFRLAEQNYYDLSLQQRSDFLGSLTPDHLCKSMIMENTKYNPEFAWY